MNRQELYSQQRMTQFEMACKKAGVKLTHQRMEIFRELAASTSHPDAEEVFEAVRKRVPAVSLDTVYRTLSLFEDIGLLISLGARHESVRFDANVSPHHHVVCIHCGLTRDCEGIELNTSLPSVMQGFSRLLSAHVEVRGICSHCTETQKQKKTKKKSKTFNSSTPRRSMKWLD